MIALEVYGKRAGELNEEQKQTVSALGTLAAGLAGGLAGNSTAGCPVRRRAPGTDDGQQQLIWW